jgi:hypothetical protein
MVFLVDHYFARQEAFKAASRSRQATRSSSAAPRRNPPPEQIDGLRDDILAARGCLRASSASAVAT